ncbi:hypothetical protein, partial [Methanothrix soehngenii]
GSYGIKPQSHKAHRDAQKRLRLEKRRTIVAGEVTRSIYFLALENARSSVIISLCNSGASLPLNLHSLETLIKRHPYLSSE